MDKSILIINTGGTISSIQTETGYQPQPGYVAQALSNMSSLRHESMPRFDIYEYSPLLDSSNMTVNEWNKIGEDIANNYDKYDGFVVLHGTDTMAYTASALSFMLENLSKPVIITGSQIPLSEVRNDARDNILTSLYLCAHHPIPEVCIYFNQRLLRGNRAQKMSAQRFDAFDSPNYPHLANIGIDVLIKQSMILPERKNAFHLTTIKPHFIANFRIFPGFSTQVLEYLLQQPIEGLILETYGAGNAQNNNKQFLQSLKKACDKGIIIINCTQCPAGYVAMDQYATGHGLKQAGLVSGHDMTPEAAHCKLLYLLSLSLDKQAIKRAIEKNLVGELTLH
ncbi:asparaginase [Legionella sp. W05-934-2]|uniref:asparaginase n=1 Tax=Legionella sp. W05-934-2 TaxID=1198649 RepID=UPI003462277E